MPNRAVVQSAGAAVKMKAKVLQDEFAKGGKFQYLLLRYTQALGTRRVDHRPVVLIVLDVAPPDVPPLRLGRVGHVDAPEEVAGAWASAGPPRPLAR